MSNLKLQGDTDSVGPLPNVPNYMPYSGTYNPLEYMPMPFYSENTVYGYNKEESVLSGSGKFSFKIVSLVFSTSSKYLKNVNPYMTEKIKLFSNAIYIF